MKDSLRLALLVALALLLVAIVGATVYWKYLAAEYW